MSDLVRSEVEAALASGVELVGDSPHLLTLFGEMQTHGKSGRWLVFPLRKGRKVSAAARAWLSTPTEPTNEQVEAAANRLEELDLNVMTRRGVARELLAAAGRIAEETP